jgi:hypothetical protein
LDCFHLADAMPIFCWEEGALKSQEITANELLLCARWVRFLVETIRPEVVIISGSLAHVVGNNPSYPCCGHRNPNLFLPSRSARHLFNQGG